MSTRCSPQSGTDDDVFGSTDVRLRQPSYEDIIRQEKEYLTESFVNWPVLETPAKKDDSKRKAAESPEDAVAPARLRIGSSPKSVMKNSGSSTPLAAAVMFDSANIRESEISQWDQAVQANNQVIDKSLCSSDEKEDDCDNMVSSGTNTAGTLIVYVWRP